MAEAINSGLYAFTTVNTVFVRAMYKKGLETINKEKTREIELFARIEIYVRQQHRKHTKNLSEFALCYYLSQCSLPLCENRTAALKSIYCLPQTFLTCSKERFWPIADRYPDLVSRLHVQIRLMGNFGFNGGVPWLTNTDGELCFFFAKTVLKMSAIFSRIALALDIILNHSGQT